MNVVMNLAKKRIHRRCEGNYTEGGCVCVCARLKGWSKEAEGWKGVPEQPFRES